MREWYVTLVEDEFSHHARVHVLKNKSSAIDGLRTFVADVRADGVLSKVEIVLPDKGEGGLVGSSEMHANRFSFSRSSLTPIVQSRTA